ncbi:MAG: hypothetical protein LUF30_09155 [Lachnospiraceae bacterium]|nr:hypothetical protein [Lachnospiraceae bacterium]
MNQVRARAKNGETVRCVQAAPGANGEPRDVQSGDSWSKMGNHETYRDFSVHDGNAYGAGTCNDTVGDFSVHDGNAWFRPVRVRKEER